MTFRPFRHHAGGSTFLSVMRAVKNWLLQYLVMPAVRTRLFLHLMKNSVLLRFPQLDGSTALVISNLCNRLLARSGGRVFSGPFAGMRLVPGSFLTSRPIWIVGCYEQEIETPLLDLITSPPSKIIDIGSAHGYYMVGLATQISTIPVVGFEAKKEVHWSATRRLAEINGVEDRIVQMGFCDIDSLKSVGEEECGLICDCEGAEVDLLDPDKLPFLRSSRIICEVHDFLREGATSILIDRFRSSHRIILLSEKPRDPFQFRLLDGLSELERILSVRETKHIPNQLTIGRYLWMIPQKASLASSIKCNE